MTRNSSRDEAVTYRDYSTSSIWFLGFTIAFLFVAGLISLQNGFAWDRVIMSSVFFFGGVGVTVYVLFRLSKRIEVDSVGFRKRRFRNNYEYDVRWESIGKIEPFTSKDGGYTFIYADGCSVKLDHSSVSFAPVIREIRKRAPHALFPNHLNAHNFPPIDPNKIEGKQDRVFRYDCLVTDLRALFHGRSVDIVLKWDRLMIGKGRFRKPFEARWEDIDIVCFEGAYGKSLTRHYFVSTEQGNGYFTEDIGHYEELIEEIRHHVSDDAYWAVEPIRLSQKVVIETAVDD